MIKKSYFTRGFAAFLGTQMLGALNDNFYKMLMQLYFISILQMQNVEELLFRASLAFTFPFFIFGPWSGYFADRFAKTRILQIVKACEILIMGLAVVAFALQSVPFMLIILFLMATQSAFFSPAKAGFIPETVGDEEISHANGWLEMTTFLAIIMGGAFAGVLLKLHDHDGLTVSLYCLAFAIIGTMLSWKITPTRPSGSHERFHWNPLPAIFRNLAHLKKQKNLFLAALGNSYFWLLGLIFQLNILVYGERLLHLDTLENSILAACVAIGIAIGSLLAARLSGHKVELGLVPLGGFGLCFFSLLLVWTQSSYLATALTVILVGLFGGFYIVPLYAYLQFEAAPTEKGKVLATVGIMNALFLVVGSFLYKFMAVSLKLSPASLFFIMGLLTIAVVIYICTVIPEYFIRFSSWLLSHTFYRIKIEGEENIPFHGPALLVVNHLSFIDAFLVGATIQRFVKFIMYKKYFDFPVVRFFCKIMEVIPIAPYEGRESVEQSLATARQKLIDGEVLCIFPEGGISRTGQTMPFKKGFETIIEGLDIPVIPVALKNVWGSIFSFDKGKVLWKFPKKFPYPITVCYGGVMPLGTSAEKAEEAMRMMLGQADG
jgi:acyl-[acyl-carrier-protein]-phospholipid O-acyltransferase / long-chain-fatty-acid--[acyl-carrier-protein] ligase